MVTVNESQVFSKPEPHLALNRDRQRKRKLVNKRIYGVFQALNKIE